MCRPIPPPDRPLPRRTKRAPKPGARWSARGSTPAPCPRRRGPPSPPAPTQPTHKLVECALAAEIAGEPQAPQNFGAREVGILAQPLRDLRKVGHYLRRTADVAARETLHGRVSPGKSDAQTEFPEISGASTASLCKALVNFWPSDHF